jgi:hypothetical protein
MKELTLSMDKSLFARLQQAAQRDGKTVNTAILSGITAYLEAEEGAHNATHIGDNNITFGSGSFPTGLN